MLALHTRCVIITGSCVDPTDNAAEEVAVRLREFRAAGGLVVAVDVLGQGRIRSDLQKLGVDFVGVVDFDHRMSHSSIWETLAAHGVEQRSAVAIGVQTHDLTLLRGAAVYVHVGGADTVDHKVRNVVPLTEQFGTGVANTLAYLRNEGRTADLLQYTDLVDFVRRARDRCWEPEFGKQLVDKSVAAATFIQERLPNDIAGVFGSGYPFYAFDGDFTARPLAPPRSVMRYFDEQLEYFRAKCMSEAELNRNALAPFDADELSDLLGVSAGRNVFDAYLFESYGRAVPTVPAGRRPLIEYLEHNCFDITTDIWPCQICMSIQSPDKHPRQRMLKDTNIDCLNCCQTSLTLRNVMGVAADVDLIVVVHRAPEETAERLRKVLLADGTYHLYDLEIGRTIMQDDGPLDVFVVGLDETLVALDRLVTPHWRNTRIPTIALWSPMARFDARLDLCFPLAFEPIVMPDTALAERFGSARAGFGAGVSTEFVVSVLREGSFWSEQLVGNTTLVELLCERLDGWRGVT